MDERSKRQIIFHKFREIIYHKDLKSIDRDESERLKIEIY